jgi:polysaccharide export outer membrane protein
MASKIDVGVGCMKSFSGFAVASATALILAGCAAMPSHGPESLSVGTAATASYGESTHGAPSADKTSVPYMLVNVDSNIMRALLVAGEGGLAGTLTDRRPPGDLRLGAGDIISVTVFESAAGGLFTPATSAGARPGNFVELPPQTVGPDGTINVPYAGTLNVKNRSPSEVERLIEGRIRNRAIEPQAVVTIREQRSSQVSVLGDVNAAAKFSLNPKGERILDVIARAGGPRYPSYETLVSVQRGGQRAQVSMATLVRDPGNNIYAQPGDTVILTRDQRHYSVLGASGQNGVYFFEAENVTLAFALGKAGGLLDERAEPAAVFLYRLENRQRLIKAGVQIGHEFPGQVVPTIYKINLRDPSGFFLAQSLVLRNRDVIFVGNSPTVDIAKLLQFIRIGINTGREGIALRNAL